MASGAERVCVVVKTRLLPMRECIGSRRLMEEFHPEYPIKTLSSLMCWWKTSVGNYPFNYSHSGVITSFEGTNLCWATYILVVCFLISRPLRTNLNNITDSLLLSRFHCSLNQRLLKDFSTLRTSLYLSPKPLWTLYFNINY